MEKIMKKAGAERVSDKAKQALKEVLEEHASKVCGDAVRLALHADRKTVKSSDIKLAVQQK
jgi:histone H3/H4